PVQVGGRGLARKALPEGGQHRQRHSPWHKGSPFHRSSCTRDAGGGLRKTLTQIIHCLATAFLHRCRRRAIPAARRRTESSHTPPGGGARTGSRRSRPAAPPAPSTPPAPRAILSLPATSRRRRG